MPSIAAVSPIDTDRKPIAGGYRIEPKMAIPVSDPPTAADRSGIALATEGHDHREDRPGRDAGQARTGRSSRAATGTSTAAAMVTAMARAQTRVKRRWSNRSAMTDDTSRPTAMPAQYSDRARVAVVSGAGSRKRTSQLETPTSEAT